MDNAIGETVAAVQAAWADAFGRRDVEGIVALYAEGTAFYGSTPDLHTDHAGVRSYFAGLPPTYRLARFARPHLVQLGPDAVAATGEVVFGIVADGTETLRSYRMTHVLVRTEAGWKIATHHASPMPGAKG